MTEPIFDDERLDVYRLAIDAESSRVGKTNLKRTMSILTQLMQCSQTMSDGSIEWHPPLQVRRLGLRSLSTPFAMALGRATPGSWRDTPGGFGTPK